jgi:hypothetical protein
VARIQVILEGPLGRSVLSLVVQFHARPVRFIIGLVYEGGLGGKAKGQEEKKGKKKIFSGGSPIIHSEYGFIGLEEAGPCAFNGMLRKRSSGQILYTRAP